MAASNLLLLTTLFVLLTLTDCRKVRGIKTGIAVTLDPTSFINAHKITEISDETYKTMEYAKSCGPIPEMIVNFLLKRIKLNFFYGSSVTTDRVVVPLSDAPKLLNSMRWSSDKPMAIYTFGWLTIPTNSYTKQIIKAYLSNGRYNLVVVDWSEAGTFLEYTMAVTMVPRVGKAVAGTVQQMLDAGATLDHVVGHSLGAQVSGHLSRNLKSRPRLVVGLDPAGPLFYPTMFQCQDAIKSTDGKYVIALHTDWNRLGSNEFTGPSDFMPSGGYRHQPGCGLLDVDSFGPACSHNRAISLWSEAIMYADSIYGRQCVSYESYLDNVCANKSTSLLAAPKTDIDGVFYFKTNENSPYGRGLGGA